MIVYLVQFIHWGERPNASNGVCIAPGLIIGYLHEVLGNQLFSCPCTERIDRLLHDLSSPCVEQVLDHVPPFFQPGLVG